MFFPSGPQDTKVIGRAKVESRALRSFITNEVRFSEVGSPLVLRSDYERLTDNTEVSSAAQRQPSLFFRQEFCRWLRTRPVSRLLPLTYMDAPGLPSLQSVLRKGKIAAVHSAC